MTMIEGVGDEVVQFVGVLLIVIVAALAWWSTNARPGRYRTVLVMRSRRHHPVTLRIGARTNLMLSGTQTRGPRRRSVTLTTGTLTTTTEPIEDNTENMPLQEMDSIADADMAMLNNNRLHFYRRMDAPSNLQSTAESTSDEGEVQEETEPASNAQIREMDSIVNAMEADVTAGRELFTRTTVQCTSTEVKKDDKKDNHASSRNSGNDGTDSAGSTAEEANNSIERDRRKILIKLKYLNDTLKEVEGSLDELLKDFKWRHFSSELTAESRVRLIFNGRVLADDAATLRACGLHHRAVVHCLVQPGARRNATNQQRGTVEESGVRAPLELTSERALPDRPWDLENILMTLVSIALTVVWFFRCEYSNMFTASASVALFGLTVFYSVAIFGMYLTDTIQIDRRAQPVPTI